MKRKCKDCKWFKSPADLAKIHGISIDGIHRGSCCLQPQEVSKAPIDFCSHWTDAETG